MIIRQLGVSDLSAALKYTDRAYRPNYALLQPEMFKWQYQNCGGEDRSSDNGALAAFVDDQVVGLCLVGRYPILAQGRRLTGGWIHFWFADANQGWAGLLLFKKALEGIDFLGGAAIDLGAASVMRNMYPHMVWFEPERLFTPIDADATAKLSLSRNEYTATLLRTMRVAATPDVEATALDRFDDEYDELWKKVSPSYSLTTDRTARFMNWRYRDHPALNYQRLICRSKAGTAIYIWREETAVGSITATVARLCEVIGEPAAIRATFGACHKAMAKPGVAFADFFCSSALVRGALLTAGMHSAVSRPGLDLPYRIRPVEPYISKRIDYYYMFPNAEMEPTDYANTDSSYITRGDGNQDIPLLIKS